MRNKKYKISFIISKSPALLFGILLIFLLSRCTKFVDVPAPITNTSTENAFKDDNTAAAVLTGLYAQISNSFNSTGLTSTSFLVELSADNLTLHDLNSNLMYKSFYQNSLEPRYLNSTGSTYWSNIYGILYTINSSINALRNNTDLTPKISKRLLGEACFLRGFCYFYLVNLYGEVPLVLSTDYDQNSNLSKNSVQDVYKQIISDLHEAEGLLDATYLAADLVSASTDRLRPNILAVYALLARVFLYQKNYAEAEVAATKVINSTDVLSLISLSDVFLKNSRETIWALQPVKNGYNTDEATLYLLTADGPNGTDHPVYASPSLMQSFEPGDDRKKHWIGSVNVSNTTYSYPAKYKVPYTDGLTSHSEFTVVLRLAEQYLIRAEARNELGNTRGALDDLNVIRTRSRSLTTPEIPNPLPNLQGTLSQSQTAIAIMQERRVELFTEWGHRWFDLKRSQTIDEALNAAEVWKGGTWSNFKALYPIPQNEINLNRSLTQNPGYN